MVKNALIRLIHFRYLRKGQIVEISEGGELMRAAKQLDFLPGFSLEGFPNRDSIKYAKYYGRLFSISHKLIFTCDIISLPGIEEANTIFRGTLRYTGFVQAVRQLQFLGLLDKEDHPSLHVQGPDLTWRKFICDLLGFEDSNIFYENLKNRIVERTGTDLSVDVLEELGLLDEVKVVKCGTPLDTLTYYLSKRLVLGKLSSERMNHYF